MGEKALVPPRLAKMRVVIFGAFFGFCLDSAFFTLVYYVSNRPSTCFHSEGKRILTIVTGTALVSSHSRCNA